MTRTIYIKKIVSSKALTTMLVTIAIASVVMTTLWQIPKATATSLEEIKVSREIMHLSIKFRTLFQMSTMRLNIGLHIKLSKILTR
jgi:hypothetical protein